MTSYIKGMGNISPQKTWDDSGFLDQPLSFEGGKLSCYEPDYTRYVEPKQLRRMSRIIKMGVAAGSMALQEAGITVPNGIITGTAYGCLDDTGIFLSKMIDSHEQALNPTPFIQSTHNTIGSQIALLLQCQGYNQTYTQSAFSFESALLDALLELKDFPAQSLLVGGVDEVTLTSQAIQKRFGIFRSTGSNLDLLNRSEGTMNGEGAAYFVLSGEKNENDNVCVAGLKTLYQPSIGDLKKEIYVLLETASLKTADIDLILVGKSGHKSSDGVADEIADTLFLSSSKGFFKHLCGEYPTASAFALWVATKSIQQNFVPNTVVFKNANRPIKRVLIYNPYFGKYHSLILVQAC